jgi:hypothetical protein
MSLDLRFEQLLAMRSQALEGVRFILLHETAVADHVGGEDSSKTAVQAGAPFGGD